MSDHNKENTERAQAVLSLAADRAGDVRQPAFTECPHGLTRCAACVVAEAHGDVPGDALSTLDTLDDDLRLAIAALRLAGDSGVSHLDADALRRRLLAALHVLELTQEMREAR